MGTVKFAEVTGRVTTPVFECIGKAGPVGEMQIAGGGLDSHLLVKQTFHGAPETHLISQFHKATTISAQMPLQCSLRHISKQN